MKPLSRRAKELIWEIVNSPGSRFAAHVVRHVAEIQDWLDAEGVSHGPPSPEEAHAHVKALKGKPS